MIPQRNISLIANILTTDSGRRIPEAVIERDYVLAWFLTGLADHPLRKKLAFKGGTALRRSGDKPQWYGLAILWVSQTPAILWVP